MLEEAKSTRERVLADLFRRRSLLQAQIDELRAGRDNLLDAYRVVKRSFLDATNALAQVEARAAEERAHGEAESSDELAEELRAATGEAEAEIAAEPAPTASVDESADAGLADVDSLFARLRAGQEAAAEAEPVPAEAAAEAEEPAESAEAAAEADGAGGARGAGGAPRNRRPSRWPRSEPSTPDVWRAKRSEVLDPLIVSMTKKAKRAAQDDQNLLLDAVRRHKGRPTSEQVLEPEAELIATWTELLRGRDRRGLRRGTRGGRRRRRAGRRVDGARSRRDDRAARCASASRVRSTPARRATRAGSSSASAPDSANGRTSRSKSCSWTSCRGAWSRGVYDASPDGAVFRWIPLVEGRCADCDDNGLEPTTKGSSFPTGQLHPPAHPGCRCLLAPADT